MRIGLVGGKVYYSYSKWIHEQFSGQKYHLKSFSDEQFQQFMQQKHFDGVNVTIPFKDQVIQYVDEMDSIAQRTQAVNTIVVREQRLIGYNTDYEGFLYLLQKHQIEVRGKRCVVLGSGATSRTVKAVLEDIGAQEIILVSRNAKQGVITYAELESSFPAQVVINTTPVGSYPNFRESPVDIGLFTGLEAVVDVIYNPYRTKLLLDAKKLGVKIAGGLAMLVAQAKKANEMFYRCDHSNQKMESIYKSLLLKKRNIVLIGLPGSGKTTIGRYLAKRIQKPYVDTDRVASEIEGLTIKEIFTLKGESHFRDVEKSVVEHIARKTGVVIATGGGIVKNQENIDLLRANGLVVFLNRDVDKIILREGKRPLIQSKKDLIPLKEQRYEQYLHNADVMIRNNFSIEESVRMVKKEINKNIERR